MDMATVSKGIRHPVRYLPSIQRVLMARLPWRWLRTPLEVGIVPTRRCNLSCEMCPVNQQSLFSEELKLDEYGRLFRELSTFRPNPKVLFWGGEPFLRKDMVEILSLAKKYHLPVSVYTNGLLLNEKMIEGMIAEEILNDIYFSVDGTEEVCDQIRGKKGLYKKIIENVGIICKYKESYEKSIPDIFFACTISSRNLGVLNPLAESANRLGVRTHYIYLSFLPEKMWQRHLNMMSKYDLEDLNADLQHSHHNPEKFLENNGIFTKIDWEQLEECKVKLPLSVEDTKRYFSGSGCPLRRTCRSPWLEATVMPNGDITPCNGFIYYRAGNLRDKSFRDIWFGEKFNRFRTVLSKEKSFPICPICCKAYGYK